MGVQECPYSDSAALCEGESPGGNYSHLNIEIQHKHIEIPASNLPEIMMSLSVQIPGTVIHMIKYHHFLKAMCHTV